MSGGADEGDHMSTHKPGVQRRRLASKLKRLRENAAVSVDAVITELDWSRSKISRIETATIGVSVPDVRALCDFYDADHELREHLADMSRQAKRRGWWHAYSNDVLLDYFQDFVELESEATSITNYEIDLMPGLLQTEDYARSIIAACTPDISQGLVERRTELRVARQKRIEEGTRLWVIIDEAVFHRGCGDPKVMQEQILHVHEMAKLPNVTLQVLPFAAGAHIAMGTAFSLLDFGGLYDPVVYIDNLTSALYIEDDGELERYKLATEHLRAIAMDCRQSSNKLEELYGRFTH